MDTASASTHSVVVGPVPFKDVVGDAVPVPLPEEYESIVSGWMSDHTLQAMIFLQRSFTARRGDVVLASLPKCGTTWLKALAFATMARGVYPPPTAEAGDGALHPLHRLNPHDCVPTMEMHVVEGWMSKIDALPLPRLVATHMQYSALPTSIVNNNDGKIVFVCREPKDMLVSTSHFMRSILPNFSFSDLFESACEGKSVYGAIWDHILGYWNASKVSPEKVLFLKYEDMLQDPANNVRNLARFLGQPFSCAEEKAGVVMDIVKLCSFENLKNLEVNMKGESSFIFSNAAYFRKGKTGDWVNHMTPEMAQRFDTIIQEKLLGSGLSFT